MTIDEAIKGLTSLSQGKFAGSLAEEEEAQKLGTEALKRVKVYRESPLGKNWLPLPGETED